MLVSSIKREREYMASKESLWLIATTTTIMMRMMIINQLSIPLITLFPSLKRAQDEWQVRQKMRHLVEVVIVEKNEAQQWARKLRERRKQQSLPLPSVTSSSSSSSSGNDVLRKLVMDEGLNANLIKLAVSFI